MGTRDMRTEWATWRRIVPLADGTKVACIDVGDGPVALFVHGIFLSSYLWRGAIDQLHTERRCIAPDLVAHGHTTAAEGATLTMHGQAKMIIDLLDAMGIDQVDLVGNDSGGGVCQIIAAHHPERLRSLLLTNCDAHDNFPPEALAPVIALAEAGALAEVAGAMAADHDIARSDAGFGSGYEDPNMLTDDAIDEFVTPFVEHPDRMPLLERFLAEIDVTELTAIEPKLAACTVPTAIVWGTDDAFFGVEWSHWLHDTIPGCETLEHLDGARLFFPDERADEFVPHLRKHWSASAG